MHFGFVEYFQNKIKNQQPSGLVSRLLLQSALQSAPHAQSKQEKKEIKWIESGDQIRKRSCKVKMKIN
jgi:hypothetical protein